MKNFIKPLRFIFILIMLAYLSCNQALFAMTEKSTYRPPEQRRTVPLPTKPLPAVPTPEEIAAKRASQAPLKPGEEPEKLKGTEQQPSKTETPKEPQVQPKPEQAPAESLPQKTIPQQKQKFGAGVFQAFSDKITKWFSGTPKTKPQITEPEKEAYKPKLDKNAAFKQADLWAKGKSTKTPTIEEGNAFLKDLEHYQRVFEEELKKLPPGTEAGFKRIPAEELGEEIAKRPEFGQYLHTKHDLEITIKSQYLVLQKIRDISTQQLAALKQKPQNTTDYQINILKATQQAAQSMQALRQNKSTQAEIANAKQRIDYQRERLAAATTDRQKTIIQGIIDEDVKRLGQVNLELKSKPQEARLKKQLTQSIKAAEKRQRELVLKVQQLQGEAQKTEREKMQREADDLSQAISEAKAFLAKK